jgi:hypothetical protein
MALIVLAHALICFFVHLGLTVAVAVSADARRIGSGLLMKIGPVLWGRATLIGGIVAVSIY